MIDRAEIYIMTDESAVVTALQSGQLDIAGVSAENAEILSGEFDIYNSPQNMVQIFALNNSVKPFDNVKVRQAISYVIDKQQVIDGVFGGYATELYSNFSPVMGTYYNCLLYTSVSGIRFPYPGWMWPRPGSEAWDHLK